MKPYNNKLLTIILLCLIGVYAIAKAFRSPGRESNMQTTLFRLDTAAVSEVDMYPQKAGRTEVRLVRQNGKWQLIYGTHRVSPMAGPVTTMLASLTDVTDQRIVSHRSSKWNDYRVGDTTGTHVIVYNGKEPLADYWLGEGAAPTAGPYGGEVSYMRVRGHDEVYALDDYMNGLFDRTGADWRDKSFLRLDKNDVGRISFIGAGGFTLDKKDSTWILGADRAKTDSIDRYLNSFQLKDLTDFADHFKPSGEPDVTIVFGKANTAAATVKAWRQPDNTWILNSSQHPAAFFRETDNDFRRDFLWTPKRFL